MEAGCHDDDDEESYEFEYDEEGDLRPKWWETSPPDSSIAPVRGIAWEPDGKPVHVVRDIDTGIGPSSQKGTTTH